MSKHFIKNIEIKNFKCFKDFKAKGFGRVNLIGGKNNVGKTAFMEACYINTQQSSQAISDIIFKRYLTNLFTQLLAEVGNKYINNFINTKAKEIIGGSVRSNLSSVAIEYNQSNLKRNRDIVFLGTNMLSNQLYDEWYSIVIEKGLENDFDKLIKNFDSNIDKFRIIQSQPKCSKKDDGKFDYLNEFGDGIAKIISFLCLLFSKEDTTIFLDEIENGIHYTNLDKLWEIILTISKQQNVQVFATTHSKECIESFNRVQLDFKNDSDDTYYFEMIKHIKTNKIFTRKLDMNQLKYELTHNGEFRG
jgi:AAA15 family ATPase/GTPase